MASSHRALEGPQPNDAPAAANAPAPTAAPSPALARVQAVRGQGWDAVEQIAAIVKQSPGDHASIMQWLQQHRGNDFVQHVVAEVSGKAAGPTTKYPVVLLHGLGASPGTWDPNIAAGLRADGDAVFEVTAPPFASPEERAKALAPQLETILKNTGAAKLNLIAWSEGGLDARYLISSMGWADRVASLSTLATPHRGDANADRVAGAIGDVDAVLGHVHQALDQLASSFAHAAAPKPARAPGALPPTLAPILAKLDAELGHLLGDRPVKLETLVNGPAHAAVALKQELASAAASLARKLEARIPPNTEPTLDAIARKVGESQGSSEAAIADPLGAAYGLSEAAAPAFNQANPNAPGVYYQSWAGIATMNGKLTPAQLAELRRLGPALDKDPSRAATIEPKLIPFSAGARSAQNGTLGDGAVAVKSAMWGDYHGEVPLDHTDFAAQRASQKDATGFDAVEFYRQIAEGLAKRGD